MNNVFKKDLILLNLFDKTKEELIENISNILYERGYLKDASLFKKAILEREGQVGTGLERGIAMPHAKGPFIKDYTILVARLNHKGIDFSAVDGEPSRLFFILAVPDNVEASEHIKTISYLNNLFTNEAYYSTLMNSNDLDEILNVLSQFKDISFEENEQNTHKDFIVAITSCVTGLAHTYMAAESLEKTAKELNISLKVETVGALDTIDNTKKLSENDIKKAKAVIIASDRYIERDRFVGKIIIEAPVKDAIYSSKELLKKALKQEGSLHLSSNDKREKNLSSFAFYKHLMTGVAYMLPFVVSGGILLSLSLIFGINSADPSDPSFNAFSKALKYISVENAFFLMIPIFSGYLSYSIVGNLGLAPGMISGLMIFRGGGGFIGGIITGFLSGYISLYVKKLTDRLIPKNFNSIRVTLIYPLFSVFIVSIMTYFMISYISLINKSIESFLKNLTGGSLVFLGALLGAMMASDLGGPINKSAAAFAKGLMLSGNFIPIAVVMAGGMIPPLGLALATTFFKKEFTQEEREAGKSCYVLGLSYITEGVIPFALSDPFRVIPSCILGSGLGGGLIAFSKISLFSSHGGIFVIPIAASSPILYMSYIFIAALLMAIFLGYLKKFT